MNKESLGTNQLQVGFIRLEKIHYPSFSFLSLATKRMLRQSRSGRPMERFSPFLFFVLDSSGNSKKEAFSSQREYDCRSGNRSSHDPCRSFGHWS